MNDTYCHYTLFWTVSFGKHGSDLRHLQYVGFVLIMSGFLFQWPTVLTLVMFPVLVFMYIKLARLEERDAAAEFGDEYTNYMKQVPAYFPNWHNPGTESQHL